MTGASRAGIINPTIVKIESNEFVLTCPPSDAKFIGKSVRGSMLNMDIHYKIIIEKHPDGFIAYPIGLKGIIVGEGDSYEDALADVKSAIRFHIESFGAQAFDADFPVLEAFVAEISINA